MNRFRKIAFSEVLHAFLHENRTPNDQFPQDRLGEAESQLGEWYEGVLSATEKREIKLPWNTEFEIPQSGLTVREALTLPKVLSWTAPPYAESHVILSVCPVHGATEYRLMKDFEGRFVWLDGLHRLLAWARINKPETRAFIAGDYRRVLGSDAAG